jgi:hypothetical protein
MGEIFGLDVGMDVPSFVSDTGFGGTLTIILIVLVLLIIGGILFYIWFSRRAFKYTINLFENIAGQGYQLVGKDRARLIKIGDGGEEILYLRKYKVYRTAYGRKMGKNTYWYAVGQDGYWYNVILGDLDAKMGMLDIEPIDRDMRYAHVAIRKNIKERYNKQSFMQKYGAQVFGILMLVVFIVGMWFIVDQIGNITGQLGQTLEANRETVEVVQKILAHADTMQSGGSGIAPAS